MNNNKLVHGMEKEKFTFLLGVLEFSPLIILFILILMNHSGMITFH
jgi:hypothetical protein